MKKYIVSSLVASVLVMNASAQDGAAAYAMCAACHGPDGKGVAPTPEMKMAPSLVGSKLAIGEPEVLARIILKGIKKEDAKYAGMMAPLETIYDDVKLAAVINHVRSSFGNTASADVTAEQAKAFREKFAAQKEPTPRAELEAAK